MNQALRKATAERKKPVQLQLNNSGAWKTVVKFDAADDLAYSHIADAANTLGDLNDGPISFRVVIEGPEQIVLTRWTKADGWKKVSHGA